ncbi:restriction endonuclease subunit S [Halopseudomonas aestusnigri]|uniref:restriction endonuclease subunit S n=1 Tax=Halopseudomonas aestusnigri TaxID=857252 RepID=UPI0028C3286E|nr:restriction endonuclease subunit S [Halopseudomonas aestusnigri]
MSSEWPLIKLNELCLKITDGAHQSPKSVTTGKPMASVKDLTRFGVDLSNARLISEEDFTVLVKQGCKPEVGDVLIAKDGNSALDTVCSVDAELNAVLLSSVAILRPDKSKILTSYLKHYLSSVDVIDYLKSNFISGAAIPRVVLKDFKKADIRVPPLPEQEAIASVLEALDSRIKVLRETNTTLEVIAQALFKSWFVDFDPVRAKAEGRQPEGMDATTAALFPDSFEESELGLVPRGWHMGTVSDLGEVICGKTPPTSQPKNYGDDVPFITIPDMHGRLVVTSTGRSLSRAGADSQKKKYLPAGSVCVSCIATPGLVVRVSSEAQTNQQINSVVPLEKWGKSFPLFLLRRIGDAVRVSGSGGSVFHNLSKSGFESLKVLLVHQELAQRFDEAVEPLVAKIMENQLQAQTLTQLRDTLLPRLISGQLRLPEAETVLNDRDIAE